MTKYVPNRLFRFASSHFFKARLSVKPLIWKWFLIIMQIKRIYTTKVSHLASFWKWDFFGNRKWLIASGIVTGNASVSYWPNLVPRSPTCKTEWDLGTRLPLDKFFPVLSNSPRSYCHKKKKQKQKTTTTKTLIPLKWIKAWVTSYFPVKMKNVVWEMSVLAVPRPPSW